VRALQDGMPVVAKNVTATARTAFISTSRTVSDRETRLIRETGAPLAVSLLRRTGDRCEGRARPLALDVNVPPLCLTMHTGTDPARCRGEFLWW